MKQHFWVLLLVLTGYCYSQPVQELNYNGKQYVAKNWKAFWVTNPDVYANEYSVTLYRRNFDLDRNSDSFIIHITADNHYELYVNGKFACSGPQRSDLYHYKYETIDIAPFLQAGKNTIAVQVVNWGQDRMKACFSAKTAFLLQGASEKESVINSDDKQWLTYNNRAFTVNPVEWMYQHDIAFGWYCANPCDSINGNYYPWNWQNSDFDDSGWKKAQWVATPVNNKTSGHGDWLLEPREIEILQQEQEPITSIVKTDGIKLDKNSFADDKKITIPANTTVTIFADMTYETIGYPVINISGGVNSSVKISYAECLFNQDKTKGNRNDIEGKQFIGYGDVITSDGGQDRTYRPTWHRAFRYIMLTIATQSEPLTINRFYNLYTAYPLVETGKFDCNDERVAGIWDICWRTARICTQDMFMSDAYYETMQYLYDTRIHAMTDFAITGDTRLWREALYQYDNSRVPDGLTHAAYPNDWLWIIPHFSLFWVDMVYDYTHVTGDVATARDMVPGLRILMNWFDDRIDSTGMTGRLEWANPNCAPIHSVYNSLSYSYSLQKIAQVFDFLDLPHDAELCRQKSDHLNKSVYQHCWSETKHLLSESPDKEDFRQVPNILGIITGAIPEQYHREIINTLYHDIKVDYVNCFQFFEAVKKAGMSDHYIEYLTPWKQMLDDGLTTCKEVNNPMARSECHPWSTAPVYYFFNILCGIESVGFGYENVEIKPVLAEIKTIDAVYPTPRGPIQMDLKVDNNNRLSGTVEIPATMHAVFEWSGKKIELHQGVNDIKL